jgi:hypothetical protein
MSDKASNTDMDELEEQIDESVSNEEDEAKKKLH